MTTNEFILHFPNYFDIRIQCERRDDFLNLCKLRFAHLQPSITLKVFGIVSIFHVTFKAILEFEGVPHHSQQQEVRH
jgi:hypothetical protein